MGLQRWQRAVLRDLLHGGGEADVPPSPGKKVSVDSKPFENCFRLSRAGPGTSR